jgi:uncharacterized LabA/DUF88 family protein
MSDVITPKRAMVFVDGFNLYHAIDDLQKNRLKWLDLAALAHNLAGRKNDNLVKTMYFSAFAYHRLDESVSRHKAYVEALKIKGVECVMGKFKESRKNCRTCHTYWFSHEEKETDVNIALNILSEALKDNYDRAYIVSCDSDLSPAFRMVKNQCPNKELVTVTTPGRFHSKELLNISDHAMAISEKDLSNHQLSDQLYRADGKIFTKPKAWS